MNDLLKIKIDEGYFKQKIKYEPLFLRIKKRF